MLQINCDVFKVGVPIRVRIHTHILHAPFSLARRSHRKMHGGHHQLVRADDAGLMPCPCSIFAKPIWPGMKRRISPPLNSTSSIPLRTKET
jgi:hypothetical protein